MIKKYKGYTIEVFEDDEPMDDEDGNILPGTMAYGYTISKGDEIIDEEHGDESEICALTNARYWLDDLTRKEN